MKNLKQLSRNVLGRLISRSVTAGAVALTAVLASAVALSVLPATALAASQPLLPFRCFAQVGVDHVVFGPDSFFLPNTIQGPTSFTENAGPTIVTYPLYHGTSQGRDVLYVITDASDRSVAEVLGVNYTPKLARAAGTAAPPRSTSHPPTSSFPGRPGSHRPRRSPARSANQVTARSSRLSSATRRSC